MITRDKVLKRLLIQEKHEGETDNIKLLRKLINILKYSSQWQALVKVKYHRHGKLSYQVYHFYYAKPELMEILELKE